MSEQGMISGLRRADVASHAFVCGDPDRVAKLSASWSGAREVCAVREYRVVTGEWNGLRLSAASTGIGAPSTAVIVEELIGLGVHTLIRVGNSGGLATDLALGDLVVTTGAVRDDGTSSSYVPPSYPAVAHHQVVGALLAAAERAGQPSRAGITWSVDAFYARNGVVTEDGSLAPMTGAAYWTRSHARHIEDMRAAGVLNVEMEAGALLTLASLYGVRAGCLCVVSDRTPWPGPEEIDLDRNMAAAIEVAHGAMGELAGG
jgi:uridine phosphorylase